MPKLTDDSDQPKADNGGPKLPAYPYYNFRKCIDVATAVKNAGGNRAPVSKKILAHELGMGADSPMFSQVIASSKVFGLIHGRGAYSLTETAKRYFFPEDGAAPRRALLEFFAKPAAFDKLIRRFDGNALPSSSSLANILLSSCNVPESWKDRTAGIFVSAAEQLGILDANRRLHYSVAVERAGKGEVEAEGDSGESHLASETALPKQPPVATATNFIPIRPPTTETSGPVAVNMNRWVFTEAGATVKVETPNPLPRALWERLTRYVAMLEPAEEAPKGGGL
jgi:hypothetical protein